MIPFFHIDICSFFLSIIVFLIKINILFKMFTLQTDTSIRRITSVLKTRVLTDSFEMKIKKKQSVEC